MVSVTNDDAGVQVHAVHHLSRSVQTLGSRGPFRFDQNGFRRYALANEIIPADFALRVAGVAARPAGRQKVISQSL